MPVIDVRTCWNPWGGSIASLRANADSRRSEAASVGSRTSRGKRSVSSRRISAAGFSGSQIESRTVTGVRIQDAVSTTYTQCRLRLLAMT